MRRIAALCAITASAMLLMLAVAYATSWYLENRKLSLGPQRGINYRPRLAEDLIPSAEAIGLADEELVVGVVIGDTAAAYPIRYLSMCDNVNDRLAGRPVCVTWSPNTFSTAVYDRRVNGTELLFAFDHHLHQQNLVITDMETKSLWSQLGAESIAGELLGTQLDIHPSLQTTWKHWNALHPDTLVLPVPPYEGRRYLYACETGIVEHSTDTSAEMRTINMNDLVLGILLENEAKAYPFPVLADAKSSLTDTVGGKSIHVHYDLAPAAWATNEAGELLPSFTTTMEAWARFHEETHVFTMQ